MKKLFLVVCLLFIVSSVPDVYAAKKKAAKPAKKVTLPTEAQWEWACRAGTSTSMNYGAVDTDFSKSANLADFSLGNYNGDPYIQDYKEAHTGNEENIYDHWVPWVKEVNDGCFLQEQGGKFAANAWGLHDMHGNVAEWTRSVYKPYPYRATDGRNDTATGKGERVVRGGSWFDRPKLSTSSFRRFYRDYQKVYNVGFRVIVE
ncbi:hypothetical protein BVY04_01795 [bacterium M21]|nr:hypothetical protein BVY04_01795 [bacterium M21]